MLVTCAAGVVGLGWALAPSATETAVANGDTRTIHFYHTHTGETIDATFRVDGHYDQAVLDKLNYFLRDWRNNDQTRMDPRLFDTVWEVYRTAGADQPIQIYSAYRSPETNAMLRRRSRAVAEHSQHMLGKAMDTTMPGMSMEKIREIGMRLQHGGVGYYQSANFVHLDVGGVRSWPRMNYDQLARLFPDGKTVHIPSNGQPMARYEEARAEIAARGGTEIPPAQQSQGFFAWLFGGPGSGTSATHEDEEERTVVASRAPARAKPPTAAATASNPEADEGAVATADARGQGGSGGGSVQTAGFTPAQQQPAAVTAVQPDRAQPPMLQTADAVDTGRISFGGVIPLPPRRPAELLASDDLLPLPPVRPEGTFAVASLDSTIPLPIARPVMAAPAPVAPPAPDGIGGLITSTSSGVPMLRRAALPAIITQGTAGDKGHPPIEALAFASADTTASLRSGMHEPVARAAPARGLALRAVTASRTDRKSAKPTALAAAGASDGGPAAVPLAGPSIYGLRKAARDLTVGAAL